MFFYSRIYFSGKSECSLIENSECKRDSIMSYHVCSCAVGYIQNGSVACIEPVLLKDPCHTTVECGSIKFSVCVNGTCGCSGAYIVDGTTNSCQRSEYK